MSMKLITSCSNDETHAYDVTSIIFKNDKIYSAADDGKIKMWNTDLKLEKEIQAHPCSVYSLTADDKDLIFSCSSDGSIRSWKANTLEEAAVILPPADHEIWKIYWADEILAAVDDQGCVVLYKNGEMGTVVEMLEQIKDIAFKDDLLYTVRDLDLVVTEILKGEKHRYTCRCTLPGRAPLALIGDKLCYSSRDGKEIFVNNRKSSFNEIVLIKNAHEMVINTINGCVKEDEYFVFSGGWDKNVKLWKIVGNELKQSTVCDVDGYVNAICVNSNCTNIFAGGADGKIWKIEFQ